MKRILRVFPKRTSYTPDGEKWPGQETIEEMVGRN